MLTTETKPGLSSRIQALYPAGTAPYLEARRALASGGLERTYAVAAAIRGLHVASSTHTLQPPLTENMKTVVEELDSRIQTLSDRLTLGEVTQLGETALDAIVLYAQANWPTQGEDA